MKDTLSKKVRYAPCLFTALFIAWKYLFFTAESLHFNYFWELHTGWRL